MRQLQPGQWFKFSVSDAQKQKYSNYQDTLNLYGDDRFFYLSDICGLPDEREMFVYFFGIHGDIFSWNPYDYLVQDAIYHFAFSVGIEPDSKEHDELCSRKRHAARFPCTDRFPYDLRFPEDRVMQVHLDKVREIYEDTQINCIYESVQQYFNNRKNFLNKEIRCADPSYFKVEIKRIEKYQFLLTSVRKNLFRFTLFGQAAAWVAENFSDKELSEISHKFK